MAGYSVRSLVELSKAARGYFIQSVDGAVASVWANTFTVVAKVLALIGQDLELRRAWLFRQMFASTADEAWLARHGFELGVLPYPAAAALGTVTLAATPGTVVPAGLQFARADGVTFTGLATATATSDGVTLAIEADAAGAAGNCDAGTALTLVDVDAAPLGLGSAGIVDEAGLAGGSDAEGLEPYRIRVVARKRAQPQGGNAGDYEDWVRDALGDVVDRVFVDSFQDDARAVWVAFTVTDQPDGIPSLGQVASAQAYLNDPVRRPVTARVYAIRLTAAPVPVAISNLAPDTPAIRASIAAEVAAVFADRANPGKPSTPFVLSRSWIDEAISRATGEDSHDLDGPMGDPVFTAGLMPTFAAPTYS